MKSLGAPLTPKELEVFRERFNVAQYEAQVRTGILDEVAAKKLRELIRIHPSTTTLKRFAAEGYVIIGPLANRISTAGCTISRAMFNCTPLCAKIGPTAIISREADLLMTLHSRLNCPTIAQCTKLLHFRDQSVMMMPLYAYNCTELVSNRYRLCEVCCLYNYPLHLRC